MLAGVEARARKDRRTGRLAKKAANETSNPGPRRNGKGKAKAALLAPPSHREQFRQDAHEAELDERDADGGWAAKYDDDLAPYNVKSWDFDEVEALFAALDDA